MPFVRLYSLDPSKHIYWSQCIVMRATQCIGTVHGVLARASVVLFRLLLLCALGFPPCGLQLQHRGCRNGIFAYAQAVHALYASSRHYLTLLCRHSFSGGFAAGSVPSYAPAYGMHSRCTGIRPFLYSLTRAARILSHAGIFTLSQDCSYYI